MKHCLTLLTFLLGWLASGSALAQSIQSYAIVVGSNRGGQGQQTLEFAERDAERMAALLPELARTPRERVLLLQKPTAQDLARALAELRTKLLAVAARGERAQLFFYYSGHARASALSLGSDEFPLDKLRTELLQLPSTLTVVVLDACQSGAFSSVKGAAPAADFSSSSIAGLSVEGVAVMASSTGSELSQESRQLAGSYFTNHFLAALRGAADHNHDGRVSLDEAYRYSYERTLADTARTAVGGQHATLETDLKGRGDVALSFPGEARAQLYLPEPLVARLLVTRADNRAVMAEAVKARGAPLKLALPEGNYALIVRQERDAYACEVSLRAHEVHSLDLGECERIDLASAGAKGEEPPFERWFFEAGAALRRIHGSDYTRTLRDFRFSAQDDLDYQGVPLGMARLGFATHPYYSWLVRYDEFAHQDYERTLRGPLDEDVDTRFSWVTRAVTLGVRARWPLFREWFAPYAEATLGLGFARSKMEGDGQSNERHFGVAATGTLGMVAMLYRPYIGSYIDAGYAFTNALDNRIGQAHDDGGLVFSTGLRVRGLGRGW